MCHNYFQYFIQSDLSSLIFQYMCSLGIEPTTFALLTQCSNHWATGTVYIYYIYIYNVVCIYIYLFLGPIHEPWFAGLPGKFQNQNQNSICYQVCLHIRGIIQFLSFQFSLHQSWVLGTMKVAWLLDAFIAITTSTPRLTCSGAGYVLS